MTGYSGRNQCYSVRASLVSRITFAFSLERLSCPSSKFKFKAIRGPFEARGRQVHQPNNQKMGRKKGGQQQQQQQQQQQSKPAAVEEPQAPPPSSEAPASSEAPPAPTEEQPAVPGGAEPVEDQPKQQKDVESLSLEEAREEIRALRKQLADRDAAARAGPDNEGMMKLQERLQQLRNEQREADAAKDAAWRQLKSVVNKISELAQAPASTPAAS
ncbi:hypothetical protein DUNSADRAFT_14588 [Dunaliella salina]|uniref:Uncharacterized protein n=1 Tax=Dunaliella salina TaxID=3046 RepID=A0ABQ7G749_DUNSA|nr:hypothetical protein DUNSADRAFT_14588 [Dunaliella salina]|eukprot:KAF5830429.1 hypothetical protein DUNSADRAFT_14588 [Dunaliella salina]